MIALWPNLIFHPNILSSDLLATFGFAAALWIATRGPNPINVATLGLLIGWMTLVRPLSLILVPAIGLYWGLSEGSLARAAAHLAPCIVLTALLIGAWTARNYVTFGEAIPLATNSGYNFWQTNHRYADGNDTFWDDVPMHEPEYQTMRYADEFTRNREGYRYGLAYLHAHPEHLLKMLPVKVGLLYGTDTSGLYEGVLNAPLEAPSALAEWFKQNGGRP